MTCFSRRTALAGLSAAIAAPAVLRGVPAFAKAGMLGPSRPTHFRFPMGDFEVTTIYDGAVQVGGPYPIFGEDQFPEDVEELAAEHNLPTNRMEIGFTVTLVNTGSELILFDTGNDGAQRETAGKLRERMVEAGYEPADVDIVVLTHFHPDHIGGMLDEDGNAAFPNARYVTNAKEYDFWIAQDHQGALTMVKPFAEKITFLDEGGAVVSGIEAMAAYGHTPGHTIYHVESGDKRLLITADTANHFVASLERPDWHMKFDMDKEAAAETRIKVFGMLAADRVPFIGYHMPFPALGYVKDNGTDGFTWRAASYEPFL